MMKLKTILAVATLVTVGLAPAAYADSVTLTLTNPNQVLSYLGGSVAYEATISAPGSNGAAVFLNGDSFNVTAPVTLDDSDLFNNFPASLAPGTSVTEDLFVLTVPPNSPAGDFLGTYTLLGGADGGASTTLGTVNFSLTTVLPEPSSIVLLLTGMAGLAMTLLWGRFRENPAAGQVSR